MLDDFPIFRRHLKWFVVYVFLLWTSFTASASYGDFRSISILFIASQSVMITLFLYGSYWAFLIRRALADRILFPLLFGGDH